MKAPAFSSYFTLTLGRSTYTQTSN